MKRTVVSLPERSDKDGGDRPSDLGLAELSVPLDLDELVPARAPGPSPWEVELGFGKGRYLLRRAQESPERRFLGVEVVGKYQRLMVSRARRRGLSNWLALRGEALYLAAAVLPSGFAEALHVYFPDPWPKSRHHKRRFLDSESIDLVLGLLRPGGKIWFATDFLDFGAEVEEVLAGHPRVELARHEGPWPDGARTNYEAKYEREGRPILRLEGRLAGVDPPGSAPTGLFHPTADPATAASAVAAAYG